MYTIDYGTGAGNETATTIEDAMETADNNATYTGCDIKVSDGDVLVATRKWNPTRELIDEMESPLDFGDYGYYLDWELM